MRARREGCGADEIVSQVTYGKIETVGKPEGVSSVARGGLSSKTLALIQMIAHVSAEIRGGRGSTAAERMGGETAGWSWGGYGAPAWRLLPNSASCLVVSWVFQLTRYLRFVPLKTSAISSLAR